MNYSYKELLKKENIDCFAPLPLSDVSVIRADKLSRMGIEASGSILILILPYRIANEDKNISAYAVPRDYHAYFSELSLRLTAALSSDFPQYKFFGAADNSPINEVEAAVKAGLGFFGENGLFISPKYGSFVFIGGIYSDMAANEYGCAEKSPERSTCLSCGACSRACPAGAINDKSLCLSAVTQKKGELDESERELIKKHGCAWGCDICQNVCPHNKDIPDTEIEFFKKNRIPLLTAETLEKMTDEEFSLRAYSWRGRKAITRNLEILQEDKKC